MEHSQDIHENNDHVVDIPERADASLSVSSGENPSHSPDVRVHENTRERDSQAPVVQSSSNGSNARQYPSVYKTVISIKLTYKLSLIITSIIVLIVSRHERPQNPLFAWIMGYIAGSAVSIPIIFQHYFLPHPRLSRLVNHSKWLLEFCFALWFVIGNYWVFGEDHSSEARNLYRLCIALLVLSYIKYIGPPILGAMVLCCCRGLLKKIGGASTDSINSLPTYKFKSHKNRNGNSGEDIGKMQGGIVASGTERECTLVGEDAVCCICLESYNDNDELKELPCSHFFHAKCVDKWLQIKEYCPLCKCSISKRIVESPSAANSTP